MTEAQGGYPFGFTCQRSGACCSGARGYVWLADGEARALADAMEMGEQAFARMFLRTVADPRNGELRLSLVEDADGRCALLAGRNECRVYGARPAHCRSFPYWESIMTDSAALARARASCPGIALVPAPAILERAGDALAQLYLDLDRQVAEHAPSCEMRGLCCRFEEVGHELFATGLEADYALNLHPTPGPPEAPGRCPYHVAGRCTARGGRPLGCRTYFCDGATEAALATVHEDFLARIRALAEELSYPQAYGRFPAMLEARLDQSRGRPATGQGEAS
ncbi:MAG: YkgJ family cysteine cluster protein [Planctomycetota bacterium]|nr:YkgJ family cysteine cluster protein [Planctomycetota bacterium]